MGTIKGIAKLNRIMFPKNSVSTSGGFTIASFTPVKSIEGKFELDSDYGTFKVKGEMPPLIEGNEYHIVVEEGERHPKFGLTYELAFMRQNIELDTSDKDSIKHFLKVILTENQIKSLYEVHDNPIELIESGDMEGLTKAKGIGLKTAQKILDHYESQKDYSFAYIKLGKYDIPPNTIRKIVRHFNSPELAVKEIMADPYKLMKIDGYGFKTCDKLYLKLGGSINSELRIKSFLIYFLQEQANNGHTWTAPIDLIKATVEYIPDADKPLIGKIMLNNSSEFYMTEDKQRISLVGYQKLEALVANELIRILQAESNFDYEGWEEFVDAVEEAQGWKFTEQQRDEAMVMMLENNISILQGYGGTGKTTTLKAVADILEEKGYLYAQCALSGKASQNLTIVTGKDGSTIHRLLGFSPMNGGFVYNDKNKLPYDIIIVDEISMVDARLFGHLLLAIRDGAKLIMLGDSQQLESIGVPIMIPMINSGVIPTMTLTQIHRQAQKSAVVTDSICIRQGKQVVKESKGRIVHGELQDLEYDLIENDDEIFLHTIREFHKYIQTESIMDVQILTQTKAKGKASCFVLNNACQKIYNPPSPEKEEVVIGKDDSQYVIRLKDKVINVKNNYSAEDEYGNPCPVFNGNIGIVLEFDENEDGEKFMLIDFEGIGKVRIYKESYNSIQLAYAITVHKSQGSSSKIIIVALPFHFLLNTRQLLYTAITRTREHCIVIATKKTLVSAIQKDDVSNKRTYLSEYLQELQKKTC